jgi:hypothetical protein
MNQSIQFKTALGLVLACLVFSSSVRAVSPAPGGGYPGANTAEGDNALFSLTSGSYNTAIGSNALTQATTGYYNTGVGAQALFSNIGGYYNTATGLQSLYSNTSGNYNSAYGVSALANNTNGNYNTATGYNTMVQNTTGFYNTANGTQALFSNTTGQANTAAGLQALYSNTTGGQNTATGVAALTANTTGSYNTATGFASLLSNSSGYYNAASGYDSLHHNTSGALNTATGPNALYSNTTGSYNTAAGYSALVGNSTGDFNTALGSYAGLSLATGDYNISIGYGVTGASGETATIRLGNGNQTRTFISGISGVTAASGVAVYVNSSGQLGTLTSSARYKEEIKPMDKASEAILGLTPVTFRYKHEVDPDGIPQFGLVAEEVAKVNPDLVARDAEGKIYTVRYEAVNAMLLNEFLKEHRKVQELEVSAAQQKKDFRTILAQQESEIKILASRIEKVSARVEARTGSSRVVNNDE